jgi:hypothetical protein
MPDYGIEVVESEKAAYDTDVGMERNNSMATSVFSSREANIAHDTNKPPAGNKHPINFAPHFFKFLKKTFVIGDMAELVFRFIITLKLPVWGRSENEMDGFVSQK